MRSATPGLRTARSSRNSSISRSRPSSVMNFRGCAMSASPNRQAVKKPREPSAATRRRNFSDFPPLYVTTAWARCKSADAKFAKVGARASRPQSRAGRAGIGARGVHDFLDSRFRGNDNCTQVPQQQPQPQQPQQQQPLPPRTPMAVETPVMKIPPMQVPMIATATVIQDQQQPQQTFVYTNPTQGGQGIIVNQNANSLVNPSVSTMHQPPPPTLPTCRLPSPPPPPSPISTSLHYQPRTTVTLDACCE